MSNKKELCVKFNPNHIRGLFDDSSECSSICSVKTQNSVRTQNSVETRSSFAGKKSQERENIAENVVDKVPKRRGRPRKKRFEELENSPEFYESRIEENEKKKSRNSSFANFLSVLENKENDSKKNEIDKNSRNEGSTAIEPNKKYPTNNNIMDTNTLLQSRGDDISTVEEVLKESGGKLNNNEVFNLIKSINFDLQNIKNDMGNLKNTVEEKFNSIENETKTILSLIDEIKISIDDMVEEKKNKRKRNIVSGFYHVADDDKSFIHDLEESYIEGLVFQMRRYFDDNNSKFKINDGRLKEFLNHDDIKKTAITYLKDTGKFCKFIADILIPEEIILKYYFPTKHGRRGKDMIFDKSVIDVFTSSAMYLGLAIIVESKQYV
uniref:Uncharacterized protein n=1 Tax=Strongyloides papillosus TaxID=174720 RepID=A0A0N5B1R3_STREA